MTQFVFFTFFVFTFLNLLELLNLTTYPVAPFTFFKQIFAVFFFIITFLIAVFPTVIFLDFVVGETFVIEFLEVVVLSVAASVNISTPQQSPSP